MLPYTVLALILVAWQLSPSADGALDTIPYDDSDGFSRYLSHVPKHRLEKLVQDIRPEPGVSSGSEEDKRRVKRISALERRSIFDQIVKFIHRQLETVQARSREGLQRAQVQEKKEKETLRYRQRAEIKPKTLKGDDDTKHVHQQMNDNNVVNPKLRITPAKAAQILNSHSDEKVCGRQLLKRHVVWPRITGGSRALFGEWPWQLSLRIKLGARYQHQCGATLISHHWAITAAHCVYNIPKHLFMIRFGEYDFDSNHEDLGHVDRTLSQILIHPQFDYPSLRNDLALLRFRKPIFYRANILPACLPKTDQQVANRTGYATGWGRTYEGGPVSNVLLKMKVPILDNVQCEAMLRQAIQRRHIPEVFLCAGRSEGGIDACEGDSGGPLVMQREDDRWTLVGVTSSGRGPGCGRPNKPGFYTRVSKYANWIKGVLFDL